jgi:hypothetical protein
VTDTLPDVEVKDPPVKVRFPFTVKACTPFDRPPAEIVRDETVRAEPRETLPATIREAKAWEDPSLTIPEVTVRVTVDDPELNTDRAPDVSQEPEADMDPLVKEMEFAEASFIVTPPTTIDDVLPIRSPPAESVRFAPPVTSFPDVVNVPTIEREPLTSIRLTCVRVPEIVKL